MAIECGMALDTFFCDAEDLFDIYYKAYQNRANQNAWLNGVYTLRTIETAINNIMPSAISLALNGGKHENIKYFDKPIDFNKSEKSLVSDNDITEEDMIRAENVALNFFK